MPGTRHELAAAAPARVTTVRGWRDLRALEPALDALQRAAGIPVTARLAWWRAALMADRDIVPLLLAMRGLGGTLMAAALVALRDQDGECRITSVRPYTDDVWDVAAVSAGARHTVLAGLVRYAARLSCPWRLTLTGLRDGEEATWLAGQLPRGHVQPAPPVPAIGFSQDEIPLGPGIRSGLDRSGHRIRQHKLTETIRFEREPDRLAELRDEIEAVHLARDHDAGRVSDLDDGPASRSGVRCTTGTRPAASSRSPRCAWTGTWPRTSWPWPTPPRTGYSTGGSRRSGGRTPPGGDWRWQ